MTYASVVRVARRSHRLPFGWKNIPCPDQNAQTAAFNYVVSYVLQEIRARHLDPEDMTQQDMITLTAEGKQKWVALEQWRSS